MPVTDVEMTDLTQRVAMLERTSSGHDKEISQQRALVAAIQMKAAVEEVNNKNITTRLDKIEGTLTWTNRIIVGGFLGALVTLVMTSGGFGQ